MSACGRSLTYVGNVPDDAPPTGGETLPEKPSADETIVDVRLMSAVRPPAAN
jgi:hypothetical protein